ncbi:MAG: NADH-quinone oxidoreductase subunit C [Coriobacteriales bacterium]|jgi:NADH:ubiquinone oxidoreductase subunit C|nr:NADH-quinone oxidoreductase subunit C [Coriobacteriales bacterium]
MDPQVFFDSELEQLLLRVQDYQQRGWRFVNLCGSSVEGQVELLYSFAQGKQLENLRLLVSNEQSVPSLSAIFVNSFFFENETHDLFGVNFKGLAPNFGGRFYPTSVPTPMNPASAQAQARLQEVEALAQVPSPSSPEQQERQDG